ncbi:hypothetical protein CEXT_24461 [Caerostris extrusa]|uniref:Uncharacterized protein n=1 Tax=Caerostris extrusa TaxID=172846 RepID=A0AAV4SNA4_CAEEX|nr:hypothetical protein CEXT_24461 [Caerostris extrusa]
MDSTLIALLPESVIADSCNAISENVNENVQHSFSTVNISEPLLNGLTVDTQEIAELHQSAENNSGNTISEKICSAKDISSTTDINEALMYKTFKDLGEISKFPQSEVENSFNVSSENVDGSNNSSSTNANGKSTTQTTSDNLENASESFNNDDNENPDSEKQVEDSDNNSSTNVNGKSTTQTTSDNLENESGSFKNDIENPDSKKKEENVASIVDPNISTSRNKRKSSSLPYYRQPKPNFYEYTQKLHEKLNPVIRFEEKIIQVVHTGKITLSSKRPTPDIIILDDYKAQKQRINCFKNQSAFSLKKESTNTSPWQKYVTLKVQLKEKIMLKKRSFIS